MLLLLTHRHSTRFLIDHFNPDQLRRYEYMRRNKFKKENVRRIVNQTLSQSVPPSVVIGIGGYTKLLVGLLIERARDVQQQRAAVAAAAYPSPASDTQSTRTVADDEGNVASTQQTALQSSFNSAASLSSDDRFAASSFERQPAHPDTDSDTDRPPELNHNDIFGPASSPPQPFSLSVPPGLPLNSLKPPPSPSRLHPEPANNAQISRSPSAPRQPGTAHLGNEGDQTKPEDTKDLGPLLPDDLREAYRRYKRSGESAGIGQGGLSLMGIGVRGTFVGGRGRGQRLFR